MAYDIDWNGIVSSVDDGDAVEAKFLVTFTNTENALNDLDTRVGTNSSDITALDARVVVNEDFILSPKPVIQFDPQLTTPVHVEGQFYYDGVNETFKGQSPYFGVELELGHSMHIHVVNNSGALIEKGMAVRHNGVAAGVVQIEKAIADSFVNSIVLGVVQEDIANATKGAVATFGQIRDLDTSSVPAGVPLYLSDTIAGTWIETKPAIVTQVGGAVTSDAVTGQLFVSIVSNKSIPTVFAGMKGQTVGNDVYNVDATPQDIDDYLSGTNVVMGYDLLTGVITLSDDGNYRMHFTASISFPSSTSTRTVFIELYDLTNTTVLYTYEKNIPRDATADGFSFSYPFSDVAGTQYKMRIYSSVAIDVAFDDVSYDVQSISIV